MYSKKCQGASSPLQIQPADPGGIDRRVGGLPLPGLLPYPLRSLFQEYHPQSGGALHSLRDLGDCRGIECGELNRRLGRTGHRADHGHGGFLYDRGLCDRPQDLLRIPLIPHIDGAGEMAVFCGAMIGASLGFLWYNAYPASIFMGDVGSLPLGGALGTVAVISKHELLLVLVGGIFVLEALSVIFQVASFKSSGKRVFLMAPIHHHFELKGWKEPKIVVRFWILSIILALLSLSTLKLR